MIAHGPIALVLNRTPANAYALNVLAAAVEAAPPLGAVRVVFREPGDRLRTLIESELAEGRRVVVGWSFSSPDFAAQSAALARVKTELGAAPVLHLAGGAHPTAEPEATLRAGFDAVAVGEGERTLRELVRRLVAGEDGALTAGLACRQGDRVVRTGPTPLGELDDFPPFAARYGHFNPIELTRGCVYACRFCQTPFMFKARFRHRSVANVCRYVRVMMDHGLFDVRFITPSALSYGSSDETVRLDRVEELLAAVRQALGRRGRIFFGTFPSEVRPEHVTPEAVRLLRRYVANDNLVIGGQSGSERLLQAVRRGHSAEAILRAARLAREQGFVPKVDLIFGLPGETREDFQATLRLTEQLAGLGARVHGHSFLPLPGTPYGRKRPSPLGAQALRTLGRLTAQGRLYGQWRQQITLAAKLAKAGTD